MPKNLVFGQAGGGDGVKHTSDRGQGPHSLSLAERISTILFTPPTPTYFVKNLLNCVHLE